VSQNVQAPPVADRDLTAEASLPALFQQTIARVPDRVAIRDVGRGRSDLLEGVRRAGGVD